MKAVVRFHNNLTSHEKETELDPIKSTI